MQKLKLVAGIALMAIPILTYAGVDCTNTKKWNSATHYKKGDEVWHHEGGNVWEKYSCAKDQCLGAGDNEPGSPGGTWNRLGTCNKDPS